MREERPMKCERVAYVCTALLSPRSAHERHLRYGPSNQLRLSRGAQSLLKDFALVLHNHFGSLDVVRLLLGAAVLFYVQVVRRKRRVPLLRLHKPRDVVIEERHEERGLAHTADPHDGVPVVGLRVVSPHPVQQVARAVARHAEHIEPQQAVHSGRAGHRRHRPRHRRSLRLRQNWAAERARWAAARNAAAREAVVDLAAGKSTKEQQLRQHRDHLEEDGECPKDLNPLVVIGKVVGQDQGGQHDRRLAELVVVGIVGAAEEQEHEQQAVGRRQVQDLQHSVVDADEVPDREPLRDVNEPHRHKIEVAGGEDQRVQAGRVP